MPSFDRITTRAAEYGRLALVGMPENFHSACDWQGGFAPIDARLPG